MRSSGRAAFAVVLACALTAPASSLAAFPGVNGKLVVAPVRGWGAIAVSVDGTDPTQLCRPRESCRFWRDPVWSPDGHDLAVLVHGELDLVYPGAGCLWCGLADTRAGVDRFTQVAFGPDGMLSAVERGRTYTFDFDGVPHGIGPVRGTDPTWSARGRLAVIGRRRHLFVTGGNGRDLRRLTSFKVRSPTWAPDGRSLAAVAGGDIVLIDLRGRVTKRLAVGSSPAFSPDGRQIAFVGDNHQIDRVSVRGGAVSAVGTIRGASVDWQPLPQAPPQPCTPPAGWGLAASSPTAIVTVDGAVYMDCVAATGTWRHLFTGYTDASDVQGTAGAQMQSVSVAGDYVLTQVLTGSSYHGDFTGALTATVHDLATNTTGPSISDNEPASTLGSAVVTADGFLAWELTTSATSSYTQTIAADTGIGTRLLDTETSSTQPAPGTGLANLAVSGETLTWTHDGTPMNATLP